MAAIPVTEAEPAPRVSAGEAAREWLASLLKILELKLQLFGFESREAGVHLAILGALIVGALACLAVALVFLAVFLLYVVIKLTGWEWGWAALLAAVLLLVLSGVAAFVLKSRITRPLYTMSLAELKKDREWLKQTRAKDK